jgi:CBS domain-containing protein
MEPVGFVARTESVLVDEATQPVLSWIGALAGLDRLGGYHPRLAAAAQNLAEQGLGAAAVGRAIAVANDALTVRLLRLIEAQLGPPPCSYAWLALGSGGRREESLHSDQDNAVVYREVTAEAERYFAALAERAVAGLAAAGLRRCPGGYVATRWRYPLQEWGRIFRQWVDLPDPEALIEAEVLLDFRRVHGDLSAAPLDQILRGGASRPTFTVQMAKAAVAFGPPLGMFGRVRPAHGDLDLKRGGIAAIVLLARLYSLAAGSVVRPTADRLSAAAATGTLSRYAARLLGESYRALTDLRLRAQLRQVAAGLRPENRVRLDDLTPEQRRRLRDALRCVQDMQQATARTYHTDATT